MLEVLNATFMVFFISSVLGWAFEVVWCTVTDWKKHRKLAYRGFLLGPYCPIYGFFAILALPALAWLDLNPIFVYFVIVALATAMEFVVATVMEKIFSLKWWDYSGIYKLNFKGRVALVPSLFWGVIGMAFYYGLYPVMLHAADVVYTSFGGWLALGLAALMAVDGVTTCVRLGNFNKFTKKIGKAESAKEIDADKYIDFVVSSIRNDFIPSIKKFVARTIPHADVSFLGVEVWSKKKKRTKKRR